MKDVFYTFLVVWIVWRIIDSIYSYKSRNTTSSTPPISKMDETVITNHQSAKNIINPTTQGEYVDFEEIK